MVRLKTWDDIKKFDDIILPEEKKIISELEKRLKKKCPYLRKEGKYFYYCGLNLPEQIDKKPSPSNPIYQRHVDLATLQLHCMDNFETCCLYSGKLKR
ncbi:hypothetical protein B6U82_01025 [Candidatus Pacearchaeota archaeon ex4484_31]|nr:MAG: hypothetical protein B6U82_01025 [Candidatus Pacearchaeota archaeon ex4484_31]